MLPHYPNNRPHHHHHHCVVYQQEQPLLPNPTAAAAAFLVPPTVTSCWDWDGYGGAQIFPADMYHHQETLEAVLRQPVTAPQQVQQAAAGERELLLSNGAPAVEADGGGARAAAAQPRRRPFRTDRHSKIRTAQGVRDRRMRLSVGVAREFFALQDRLGFDKASKTVNWLLTQSKPAIDRLSDASELAAAASAGPTAARGRGEGGSSSSTGCVFADSRGKAIEKARSRGGCHAGPPAAPVEEDAGGEIDWIMTEATAAAAATAAEQPLPMEGLEYYYQYYLQLEDMMRCNNGGGPR